MTKELTRVRTIGYLPADPWRHYVECTDGNVWSIDSRSGQRTNNGPVETFMAHPERYRITFGTNGIRG